ncbi:MAG: glutamine--fructose-6-phosphate aminotransferase, partial [Flavobacteriales bacterium]
MCGIVGYLGPQPAYPILIDGLKRLEYRGYDSAGVATLEEGSGLRIEKKQGKVANLEGHVGEHKPMGTVGIGHTRWATHGPPSDVNAHPHAGGMGRIAVIHNGIIENYEALRELLTDRGHNLVSETDTEVLAHFIEEVQTTTGLDLPDAVRTALKEVVGAYALVVLDETHPDRLIAARKSSPLVIGIGQDNEFFVGSDATPIVAHTKNVIYLEDEEVATMHRSGELTIRTIGDTVVTPEIHAIELEMASLEKAGYDH